MYGEYQGKQLEIRCYAMFFRRTQQMWLNGVDTDVMLADPLTKAMDASKLMAALDDK